MENSSPIVGLASMLVGAGIVWGVMSFKNDGDDVGKLRAELAETQAELTKLKARTNKPDQAPKLTSLPSAIPDKVETVAAAEVEEPAEEEVAEQDPAAALAKLFNSKEARGLMKKMSAGFAQRGEQWIENGIAEYTEKLNLSDEQVAKLKDRLSAQMNEQTEAFTTKLDDEKLSMQEIMMEQRAVMEGQEDVMAEILKEELSEEQFAEFEREQLVEKTQRVQRDADRELVRLDRDLELSDSQEDQVFGILVQTNSDFDNSMAIEGADAEVTIEEGQAKEDAIRSVLDPEQTEKYNQSQEERQNRRGGFGGGFGGFGR